MCWSSLTDQEHCYLSTDRWHCGWWWCIRIADRCMWASSIMRNDIENHAGKSGNFRLCIGSTRNKLSMYIQISSGSSIYALFGALYLKNWKWHFQRPCTFITRGRHEHSQQWSTFELMRLFQLLFNCGKVCCTYWYAMCWNKVWWRLSQSRSVSCVAPPCTVV